LGCGNAEEGAKEESPTRGGPLGGCRNLPAAEPREVEPVSERGEDAKCWESWECRSGGKKIGKKTQPKEAGKVGKPP